MLCVENDIAYGLVSLTERASVHDQLQPMGKVIFALMWVIFEREEVGTHPGPIVTNHHFSPLAVHLGHTLPCLTTAQVSQANLC